MLCRHVQALARGHVRTRAARAVASAGPLRPDDTGGRGGGDESAGLPGVAGEQEEADGVSSQDAGPRRPPAVVGRGAQPRTPRQRVRRQSFPVQTPSAAALRADVDAIRSCWTLPPSPRQPFPAPSANLPFDTAFREAEQACVDAQLEFEERKVEARLWMSGRDVVEAKLALAIAQEEQMSLAAAQRQARVSPEYGAYVETLEEMQQAKQHAWETYTKAAELLQALRREEQRKRGEITAYR